MQRLKAAASATFRPAGQHLVVADRVELDRVGVAARVAVVDAVDGLGHQQRLAADLERPLRGDGVGREERHAGAGAEDDDAALVEVPHRPARDVRLGDLAHGDGGLHAGVHPGLLEQVLQRQAVHDRAEHAHVVGPRPVHAALGDLGAAEEVAAAHDDRHLHAGVHHVADLPGDVGDDVEVEPDRAAAEDLAGQLQQHPLLRAGCRPGSAVGAAEEAASLSMVTGGGLLGGANGRQVVRVVPPGAGPARRATD
jgi:hypothetical protein